METIYQVYEKAPASIVLPPELRDLPIEIEIRPLAAPAELDALGWPTNFFETTYGSIPDLPYREPQGDYEDRETIA